MPPILREMPLRRWQPTPLLLGGILLLALASASIAQAPKMLNQQQVDLIKRRQMQSVQSPEILGASQPRPAVLNQDVTLKAGEFVRTRVPPQTRMINGARRNVLPLRLTGFDSSNRPVDLALFLQVQEGAMRLTEDGKTFEASAVVGLTDSIAPDEMRPLARSIELRVFADGADVDNKLVTIDKTNDDKEVRFTSDAPGDSVVVTLRLMRQAETTAPASPA